MSYVRIWVHLVFSTKNREPFLNREIRYTVQKHIIKNCEEKEIFLRAINGYTELMHCLISLGKEQTVSKIAQLIKGESAFWINKTGLIPEHFIWQDDYFAISVGESQVNSTVKYIHQEKHHIKKPFEKEASDLLTKHGFLLIKDQKFFAVGFNRLF
jgi:putative transposase